MTASQPQGAPNTTGSVSTDTANGPDPYRATQGETCLCTMCRKNWLATNGLVWSIFAASLDPDAEQWAPSHAAVVVGD